MIEGLPELAAELEARGIGFLLRAHPDHDIAAVAHELRASLVVSDEDPRRTPEQRRRKLAAKLEVPFWTVDADVVVPRREIGREHWAARTIRPRIHEQLERFLVAEREVRPHVRYVARRRPKGLEPAADLVPGLCDRPCGRAVERLPRRSGGRRRARLRAFLRHGLPAMPSGATIPSSMRRAGSRPTCTSASSARAGSLWRCVTPTRPSATATRSSKQLIVRRELAVNFVAYNPAYDRLAGCENWARRSLSEHARDPRTIVSAARLEAGESPDPLWNAAQIQMVEQGFMHGYMRMYWANGYSSGHARRAKPTSSRSRSTTATSSTDAIRTATRASPGRSAASTTRRGESGRYSVRCASCHALRQGVSSTRSATCSSSTRCAGPRRGSTGVQAFSDHRKRLSRRGRRLCPRHSRRRCDVRRRSRNVANRQTSSSAATSRSSRSGRAPAAAKPQRAAANGTNTTT